MKSVISSNKKIIPLDEAVSRSAKDSWRCAKCLNAVAIRSARGKPIMTHMDPETACDGEMAELSAASASNNLAIIVAQYWSIAVKGYGTLHIERVCPLILRGSELPLIVIQTIKFTALAGVVHTKQDLAELEKIARKFRCPTLALHTSDREWGTLEKTLVGPVSNRISWIYQPPTTRDTAKKLNFAELVTNSLVSFKELSCKKGLPYHPAMADNERQYIQDIVSEVRQQGWSKRTKRLLLRSHLSRSWWRAWFMSNNVPVQVPLFWLWFWVVKHALHTLNRKVDPDVQARDIALLYQEHKSYTEGGDALIEELKEPLREMLELLCVKGYLVHEGTDYRCVRTARE